MEAATRFYTEILGGTLVSKIDAGPTIVKLTNAWITLVEGGGPTPDKPTVNLAPPSEPDQVDSFLNLRVADIDTTYREWKTRGAKFITEPIDNHGHEMRCYRRDPSGHLIELGQATS